LAARPQRASERAAGCSGKPLNSEARFCTKCGSAPFQKTRRVWRLRPQTPKSNNQCTNDRIIDHKPLRPYVVVAGFIGAVHEATAEGHVPRGVGIAVEGSGRPVDGALRGPKYGVDRRDRPGIDNPLEFLNLRQAPITVVREAAEAVIAISGYLLIERVKEFSERRPGGKARGRRSPAVRSAGHGPRKSRSNPAPPR
jgi:hypothetical protein